jgi:hypothetical protein
VVGPQLMELPPGVRHALRRGHALLEARAVAAEPVGDQRALPGAGGGSRIAARHGAGESTHTRQP